MLYGAEQTYSWVQVYRVRTKQRPGKTTAYQERVTLYLKDVPWWPWRWYLVTASRHHSFVRFKVIDGPGFRVAVPPHAQLISEPQGAL